MELSSVDWVDEIQPVYIRKQALLEASNGYLTQLLVVSKGSGADYLEGRGFGRDTEA